MKISVQTSEKTYEVMIRSGLINQAGHYIEKMIPASSYLVIVDQHVASYYLEAFLQTFHTANIHVSVVPSGEQSKSFQQYEQLLNDCYAFGLDRSSVIIAFGGGVTGDLAGFVAGTYMRGIRFVQVPTTLLAHDSSVGGKVAINLAKGKNIVGLFHQPELVLYDPDLLRTLPNQEWRSGFAEIVKMGFIADKDFLLWLKAEVAQLPIQDEKKLEYMIGKAVALKADIVQQDEKEMGIRGILNFGHTLGHAIEGEMGYGALTHGEAVAIGMAFALKVSEQKKGRDFSSSVYLEWLASLGYRLTVPQVLKSENLLAQMMKDKKARHGTLNYVLLEAVGDASIEAIDATELKTFFD
ncbi:3-dehydroquinate synthase [Alkalihalobacillus sp. LMS6]|uniref:3-dehydroquinate synthase n=1 Tax=Alkalihalobacillus sp. LMS6 TaxID=2924034 RepID=UPI0020D0E04A|nr:3-dehydroquinate synthase [Alkalihalobacillus sp. LMS6]UTR08388.1 3-dehydroquinate synthase [Alkalihalobacillus sp. LMS6]